MKYLTHILITIIVFSCCGSKTIAEKPINNSIQTVSEETTQIPPDIETTSRTLSHKAWDNLLKKHVSIDGDVNYNGFKTDALELKNYINLLSENLQTDAWSKNDKLAYWINAYNAMTVDLIVQNYPIKSIKDINNPWKQSLWKLGDKWYNLNEIEHDILREMYEPRIHFAIVCASISCPKLLNEAYIPSKLDMQLTIATEDFLSDTNRNTISQNNINISKIFKWFTKDFTQNGSLIDFLNQYSDISISENVKIYYQDYNWNLNE